MKHLIILEDEPLILKYLTKSLSKHFSVSPFNCPDHATDFIKHNKTDYVLCDYMLGNQNGLDFLSAIINNNYINNPQKNFIFMTAYEDNNIYNKLLSTGCRIIRKQDVSINKIKGYFEV